MYAGKSTILKCTLANFFKTVMEHKIIKSCHSKGMFSNRFQ